ncbi:hypothetical protein BLTE_02970 [Blastochloris tepida]|uniref:Uncharacterized protein n=1 Tax=Blastochloris tepida TaxID=2233851 RepID=A0A348FWC9_9HYPH|nr:hypothetical protein BLTE_02970 [Blastochloris tepida]
MTDRASDSTARKRTVLPKPFAIGFRPVRLFQQVFWLSDQPPPSSLPNGVVPISGLALALEGGVPDYSGGSATEFHRVPGYWNDGGS